MKKKNIIFYIKISKKIFLNALSIILGVIDKKNSVLSILDNILVDSRENKIILSATNLEIKITTYITCNENILNQIKIPGIITIPGKKLFHILKLLNLNDTPSIIAIKDFVLIKTNNSKFLLNTLPYKDYPISNFKNPTIKIIMRSYDIVDLFQFTYFVIPQNDSRIYLNGLLLDFTKGQITSVSTDGYRMAIKKIFHEKINFNSKFLLPKKGVQEILKLLLNTKNTDLVICGNENYLRFYTKLYNIELKLIKAKFPSYQKIIPTYQDKIVLIDRDKFKQALKRVSILTNEKSKAIILHIKPSILIIKSTNKEKENAIELLNANIKGKEIKIGVNVDYLLDILNILPKGLIKLSMQSSDSSILIQISNNDNYKYIVMPMKI
ncbi:DNA polymerase III subunit beta [Candidatus Legionella polyplacis]|uniref:DNA polymerase III subunit beta n=1 Tax=Candidatus Legionella polyplacis TaxID=2005262 RepID=UPI000C1F023F|nr:DNA polymerase III subunit beta [Candidatus Legionella polyplacis]ATW01901.1 DNA polymerase III subunit beta [Candidatus Legionella polyplacis]